MRRPYPGDSTTAAPALATTTRATEPASSPPSRTPSTPPFSSESHLLLLRRHLLRTGFHRISCKMVPGLTFFSPTWSHRVFRFGWILFYQMLTALHRIQWPDLMLDLLINIEPRDMVPGFTFGCPPNRTWFH